MGDATGLAGGSGSPASLGRAGVIASAWLIASLAGVAVGIAVSASLISQLK